MEHIEKGQHKKKLFIVVPEPWKRSEEKHSVGERFPLNAGVRSLHQFVITNVNGSVCTNFHAVCVWWVVQYWRWEVSFS